MIDAKSELSLQFKLDSIHEINRREKKSQKLLLLDSFLPPVTYSRSHSCLRCSLNFGVKYEGGNTTDAMRMLPGPNSTTPEGVIMHQNYGIIFEYVFSSLTEIKDQYQHYHHQRAAPVKSVIYCDGGQVVTFFP